MHNNFLQWNNRMRSGQPNNNNLESIVQHSGKYSQKKGIHLPPQEVGPWAAFPTAIVVICHRKRWYHCSVRQLCSFLSLIDTSSPHYISIKFNPLLIMLALFKGYTTALNTVFKYLARVLLKQSILFLHCISIFFINLGCPHIYTYGNLRAPFKLN